MGREPTPRRRRSRTADLPLFPLHALSATHLDRQGNGRAQLPPSQGRPDAAAIDGRANHHPARRPLAAPAILLAIGRGWCRETVWQYVWISVVAVALKKKKKT